MRASLKVTTSISDRDNSIDRATICATAGLAHGLLGRQTTGKKQGIGYNSRMRWTMDTEQILEEMSRHAGCPGSQRRTL